MCGELILWVKLSSTYVQFYEMETYCKKGTTFQAQGQLWPGARQVALTWFAHSLWPTPGGPPWNEVKAHHLEHSPGAQTRWAFDDWLHPWSGYPACATESSPGGWAAVSARRGDNHTFSPSKSPFQLLILGEDDKELDRNVELPGWTFGELQVFCFITCLFKPESQPSSINY